MITWFDLEIPYQFEPLDDAILAIQKELVDRKDELEYDDRIDTILLSLEYLGYTWEEYREERKQQQYYIDMKRKSIDEAKNIRSISSRSDRTAQDIPTD